MHFSLVSPLRKPGLSLPAVVIGIGVLVAAGALAYRYRGSLLSSVRRDAAVTSKAIVSVAPSPLPSKSPAAKGSIGSIAELGAKPSATPVTEAGLSAGSTTLPQSGPADDIVLSLAGGGLGWTGLAYVKARRRLQRTLARPDVL